MKVNFDFLKERVVDSLNNTDLDYIRNELSKLDKPKYVFNKIYCRKKV